MTAGQYRNTSLHSHPLMFQGTLQHGFSNLLTGYGGVAVAEGYGSALLGVALNTSYGAFGADVTHATTRLASMPDRTGQSLRLNYSKLITPTNTNLTLAAYRYSTSGFLSLADAMVLRDLDQRQLGFAMNATQRGRLQLTVNQTLPGRWGSFYLSGSTQNYWNRKGSDTQFVLGYNNSFGRINLGVTASRQFNVSSARWENRVMLNLGVPLGKGAHAPYSMTSAQTDLHGATSLQESVTGSLGVDNAFTYGLNAGSNDRQGEAASVGANAGYVAPFATLTGSASTSRNYTQTSAGISGGIVAYPGGVAFTPTHSDTVAVIEADSAAGARAVNNNGARVDPWGHAVVSGLMPFARNEIEIDPRGLPLDVEFKSTTQAVVPTAGAVVVARFDTSSAGRAAVLRVLTRDGRRLPFGSEVVDAEGNPVGTVGQGGRIVAQGLKADSGELHLFSIWSENKQHEITSDPVALPQAGPPARWPGDDDPARQGNPCRGKHHRMHCSPGNIHPSVSGQHLRSRRHTGQHGVDTLGQGGQCKLLRLQSPLARLVGRSRIPAAFIGRHRPPLQFQWRRLYGVPHHCSRYRPGCAGCGESARIARSTARSRHPWRGSATLGRSRMGQQRRMVPSAHSPWWRSLCHTGEDRSHQRRPRNHAVYRRGGCMVGIRRAAERPRDVPDPADRRQGDFVPDS